MMTDFDNSRNSFYTIYISRYNHKNIAEERLGGPQPIGTLVVGGFIISHE